LYLKQNDKIFVAGHNGLVGSAIIRHLKQAGFNNLITRERNELDLINQSQVAGFFKLEKPKYVILAAAKVGGIYSNNTYPAEFIYENLMIESNVIHASYVENVKRLLFLGSTCIYPRNVKQPMKEDALLTGVLESSNEPYALAKIAGIKLCESYNRQYGSDFRSLMPTNLYGANDNFHSKNSHVIPSLIRRFHDAKMTNLAAVEVWGTGSPLREFLHVDDLASGSIFFLNLSRKDYENATEPMNSHLNIGTGKEISIKELAQSIKRVVGYEGDIKFDKSKPDGSPRKLIDTSKLSELGWKHSIKLEDGLERLYEWYKMDNLKRN